MIIVARILSILLGLIVVSKSYFDYKKKNESLFMFLFWLFTWSTIIILSIFPYLIELVSKMVGDEGTGVNTFVGASIVFLFFVTYRVYTKANRLERKIQEMVMKLGLKDLTDLEK